LGQLHGSKQLHPSEHRPREGRFSRRSARSTREERKRLKSQGIRIDEGMNRTPRVAGGYLLVPTRKSVSDAQTWFLFISYVETRHTDRKKKDQIGGDRSTFSNRKVNEITEENFSEKNDGTFQFWQSDLRGGIWTRQWNLEKRNLQSFHSGDSRRENNQKKRHHSKTRC